MKAFKSVRYAHRGLHGNGVSENSMTAFKLAKEAGIRDSVKIMVGGAPISQEFCDKIGADAYTSDAASCAELALELCK